VIKYSEFKKKKLKIEKETSIVFSNSLSVVIMELIIKSLKKTKTF